MASSKVRDILLPECSCNEVRQYLKTGRGVVWEQKQCAGASDWRTKNSQCACAISVVRWILAVDVRCGRQSDERLVLIVTARGTGRRRRINIIIREWKEEAIRLQYFRNTRHFSISKTYWIVRQEYVDVCGYVLYCRSVYNACVMLSL